MRFREIVTELRPHALWDGIKFCFILFGGGGIGAAIFAVRNRWIHQNLDITAIIAVFVISLAMLLVGMFVGGRRVAEAKTTEATASPHHEAGSQNEIIKLQATGLDPRSTDPNVRYRAKLRLNFTNQSKEAIEVLEPTWTASQWDVPFQHPFGYCYRIESNPGGWKRDEWNGQELKKAHVDPDQGFQIYVGLSESIPPTDLEKRRFGRRLGTLTIPIKIGSRDSQWKERV
jgi:hypothetical protein